MLIRSMNITHVGADGYTVQIRDTVREQAAFDAGVYSIHGGFLAEQFLIAYQYLCEIRLPGDCGRLLPRG